MSNELVSLKHIGKKYEEKEVLTDVNLKIQRGEFVSLVGKSGGGKSTLLRLIAGLEKNDGGSIEYPAAPVIRVMFQNDRLLPWMTVIDNVCFREKDHYALARKLLQQVGLSDFAEKYPDQLSGGQRQRVALARALMAKPDLLLLDEPLGALDALTRSQMQELILDICNEQQVTLVIVTHDVNEAAKMGQRVVIMKNGQNHYEAADFSGDVKTEVKVTQQIYNELMEAL